jgi:SAM-dependent methyltransferase
MNSICPACGSTAVQKVGIVNCQPSEGFSASQAVLWECPICALRFLTGGSSEQTLMEAYEELPSDAWDDIPRRRDFDLARAEITRRHPQGRVLDIGCFRGDFLQSLPPAYERYGIEPSRAARAVAESRNIRLIGTSISDCQTNGIKFDVIVLTDVIEHLPKPFAEVQQLASWLAPGGSIIISTGNTDALPWRLTPLNYWYYIAQHVSFFNPRWFHWAARQLGLEVGSVHRFSHSRRAYGKWFVFERWRQLARSVQFWLAGRLALRPDPTRALGSATWPDHLLVVLRSRTTP